MTEPTTGEEAADTEILLAKVREKQDAQGTVAHGAFMYGPESAVIAPSLERVGRLELDLGNVAAAKEPYQRALKIDEASLGVEHPTTVRCREELEGIQSELGDREDTDVPVEQSGTTP